MSLENRYIPAKGLTSQEQTLQIRFEFIRRELFKELYSLPPGGSFFRSVTST